jgi:hypothetical protein
MAVRIFTILSLVAILFSSSGAMGSDGFERIRFGTPYQTVLEEIMKMGYEPKGQGTAILAIPEHRIAGMPVQVQFFFNRNNKFCAFEIRTGKQTKERYHKVIEVVKYMSELFQKKWGPPSQKYYPRMEELTAYGKKYWEWNPKGYAVFTSLIRQDGQYFTKGIVFHIGLAEEPEQ